ncbi:MAG: type II toxin-antitoxin system RelE/ParE family toxin [Gammaproteobacteria bacterium]
MVYEIRLHRSIEKTLAAIDAKTRRRIREVIDGLAAEPRPPGVKKLAGRDDAYRIRVGSYRVLYKIVDSQLLIYVIAVDHRSRVYRESR